MLNAFRKSFEGGAAQNPQLMIPEAINAFRPAPLTHCLTTSAKHSGQYLCMSFSSHETNFLGKPSNSQPQDVQVKRGFALPLIFCVPEEAVTLPLFLGAIEENLQGAKAPSRM